ncbi:alpha-E domain-containing protein [Nitrogeniibacter aestuarii]|uniref:alpha-E domain-containing protein n=1 Tax=Nitrogeniibacter aestuarii TaxID=2815343 RepID=UPI001D11DDEA|nr:alpha-E domain-containing protein [Nitrogeniibacter aestuarii]
MLSRTADHLYWMARYIERAECLARLLDVTWQMSLVPQSTEVADQNWRAIISLNSLEEPFFERFDEANANSVLRFMLTDMSNPASVYNCLRMCRENARAVRDTITADMWETFNTSWLELQTHRFDSVLSDPAEFFEWVKLRSSLVRGATLGTMLQDEAYNFIRLGTVLERADNTARILDVKYHGMQPGQREGTTDFYQWGALLRSVSAFEVYRKTYRSVISPSKIAELLILHPSMPRSLNFCMRAVVKSLELVANEQSGETQRRAGKLYSEVRYGRIDDILSRGLHVFLTDFMSRIEDLGDRIHCDFLETSIAA